MKQILQPGNILLLEAEMKLEMSVLLSSLIVYYGRELAGSLTWAFWASSLVITLQPKRTSCIIDHDSFWGLFDKKELEFSDIFNSWKQQCEPVILFNWDSKSHIFKWHFWILLLCFLDIITIYTIFLYLLKVRLQDGSNRSIYTGPKF